MTNALEKMPVYQRAIAKAHLGSCGARYDQLGKPVVAVVNTWNEIVPGHCHLRELAIEVKQGIQEAGGYPLEFNTIAICDGIAQGHRGMHYVLPSRDLIADSIETMIIGHGIFDAMVLIGSCDKIVPGLLMAAARLNIPAIVVTGGPMINEIKPWQSKEARQRFLRGEISEAELFDITLTYYPTAGVCPFLGTANTMCLITEALGMSLSGSATAPAQSTARKKIAYESGQAIMRLLTQNIRPRDIMTQKAFHNAITLVAGIGGSLNSILHIPAIAHECGLAVGYQEFDQISRCTPLIVRVSPNSPEYTVADLDPLGGIPAIMKELFPVLQPDVMTVDGRMLVELLDQAPQGDGEIIRFFSNPFAPEGGIAVLSGNLAPAGAVVKSSAVPPELWTFSGVAKVFESEEACTQAVEAGQIQTGEVLVIRNEGPKGGPGMREMHRITELIVKLKNVAVITDGRFSGASAGLPIGYLSPEAADNGPIAFVKSGDRIEINIHERSLHWDISDSELAQRRRCHRYSNNNEKSVFLQLYAHSTASAANGAVRRNLRQLEVK
jgi:dihydroxy-acid dehydratase